MKNLNIKKDSYRELEEYLNKQNLSFLDYSIEQIESFYKDKNIKSGIDDEWGKLKKSFENNEPIYIRRSSYNDIYKDIYSKMHWENIKIDYNGNHQPHKTLGKITKKYVNNQDFKNLKDGEEFISGYSVSHIWGFTHNPYLFNCPWNICYTPNSVDPLTGHMTKSDMKNEFKEKFINSNYYKNYVQPYANEYNDILNEIKTKIEEAVRESGKLSKIQEAKFLTEWEELTDQNIFESYAQIIY